MNVPTAPKSLPALCAAVLFSMILWPGGGRGLLSAAEVQLPFATFNAKVEIDIEDGEIEVMASFTLGASSNGVDPAKEPVSLRVAGGSADYSVIIPAGAFKMSKSGEYNFMGIIGGVRMIATIRSARAGAFEFEMETASAKLNGMANPVTLSLGIGDDGASRTVRAKIE